AAGSDDRFDPKGAVSGQVHLVFYQELIDCIELSLFVFRREIGLEALEKVEGLSRGWVGERERVASCRFDELEHGDTRGFPGSALNDHPPGTGFLFERARDLFKLRPPPGPREAQFL